MKNIIKFILFLIYVIGIFFINNDIAISLIACINVTIIIMAKINVKKAINLGKSSEK